MNYLLDTNTVSELMRSNPKTVERLKTESPQTVFMAQPVIAEIEFGLKRLPKGKRKQVLMKHWHIFKYQLKRADWTDEVSETFGSLKANLYQSGAALEDFDIFIAAHAIVHDMCLVTNNTKHMQRITDITLEDWS